jgi:hypothetical protein
MIDIQIKTGQGEKALAQMIASTQGENVADPAVAQVGALVRDHQAEQEKARPSVNDLQTVDFQKLDAETDWSDV